MKLIYRGASYEYDPTQARLGNTGRPARSTQQATPYTLSYRGVTMQIDPGMPTQEAALPTQYDLIYRGVNYNVSRDNRGNVTALTEAPDKVKADSVPTMSTLPGEAVNRVHRANLMNDLQRRLQVAQERGDQQLVALLEVERQQIAAC